jgi:uncharacterized membrane protein YbaN (DUF454 family)
MRRVHQRRKTKRTHTTVMRRKRFGQIVMKSQNTPSKAMIKKMMMMMRRISLILQVAKRVLRRIESISCLLKMKR